ncbi:MAG: sugar nucleotide-binding protein [Candidatus Jorgensenbacteria bacterium]
MIHPKVQFGVLGCSRVAQKGMLPAMLDSQSAELAMVGSRSPEKAKEVAKQFKCDSWGTYEEVINNKDIDVVYISLPNALHEEWVVKAARAGKHVICEKPAAISYAAAKRMVEAAKENKVRLLEGFMFRYHPQHAKVETLIREGVLGKLLRFEGCFGYSMPERGSNIMNKDLVGGSFYASAPYPVYASRMIFGEEPESVLCNLTIDPESGVDVRTDMVLHYPGGKSAFASSLFGSYFQSTYSVLGSKAHVRMARAYAVPRDMKTKIFLDADDEVQEFVIEPADHFRLMLDDFCEKILKGDAGTKNYEGDLLAQARVFEAARLSDKEKRTVKISEIDGRSDAAPAAQHTPPATNALPQKKYSRILLTGGSGNLGRAITRSGIFPNITAPPHEEIDITDEGAVTHLFETREPDAVIHCAALVRMAECEKNPQLAIKTNIVGTYNLVKEILKKEQEGRSIRFIYISTDGVYAGTKGDYSENDETIPYNTYGWTKLGGECVVRTLPNFCIIRTSFFDPKNIPFDTSATDMYSSKMPVDDLPQAIATMLKSNFVGTINVGGERKSHYERYREFKPSIKPCTFEDVAKNLHFNMAKDASLNVALWNKIVGERNNHAPRE